jgi:hypothetical protein
MYAGIAAAGAIAIGVAMVKAQIDIADATIKTADKLGTTAEAVSALNYVASLADVSAQELANSLQFMNRNLSDAAKGTGEARFALKDLGLSAKELKDLKPEDAMLKIAGALEKIPSQADRAAIAADIFNDRTGKMLNVLKGGPDAIRANIAEAERFGKIISTETARAAENFNDNVTRLKANLEGLAIKVMPAVLESLNAFAEMLLGPDPYDELLRRRMKIADQLAGLDASALGGANITAFRQKLEAELKEIDQKVNEQAAKWRATQAAIKAGSESGTTTGGGIDSRAQEEADKRIAQERERLSKEVLEIHRATLSEKLRAAEEYVEKHNKLTRGRVLNEIKSDQELNERRLELAAQYEAQLAELNKPDQSSVDRLREELTARGVAIAESYISEAEQLRIKKENELAILDEMEMRDVEAQINYKLVREQLEAEHVERMKVIQKDGLTTQAQQQAAANAARSAMWLAAWKGDLAAMAGVFGEMSGLMTSGSKKMFKIGKIAAIAQATLSTYLAVQNALATVPFFPVGLAMGATSLAMGLANIAKIKSTEFGSGGGAVGTFKASPSTGLPETGGLSGAGFGPSTVPAPAAAAVAPQRTVNLFLNSDSGVVSTPWIRDVLIPGLNEAISEGVTINIRYSGYAFG